MNTLITVKSLKSLSNTLLFALVIFQNSVTAEQKQKEWQSPFFQDHVLVGKIWDTHKQSWLTKKRFYSELPYYDYILLGENHNNADHHILQSRVINSLVSSGAKPTVVMEMLSQDTWQNEPHVWSNIEELQSKASQLNEGWPWELYAPILKSAVQHQLKLYAGNISSKELHRWANDKSGDKEIDLLDKYFYTNDNFNTLTKNIIKSHCGHANQGFVTFMSRAQMQRDRVMTTALIGKDLPVVFIAGSGHIRNDYAVPMQLRKKFNKTSYLSIAFISVQKGREDPHAYLQNVPMLYDILYFTPSHTHEDPCEKFRKQLKNMHHRQTPKE